MSTFKVGDTVALRKDPSTPYATVTAVGEGFCGLEMKKLGESVTRVYRTPEGEYLPGRHHHESDVIPYVPKIVDLNLKIGDKVTRVGRPEEVFGTIIDVVTTGDGKKHYLIETRNNQLQRRYADGNAQVGEKTNQSIFLWVEPPKTETVEVLVYKYTNVATAHIFSVVLTPKNKAEIERGIRANSVIELARTQVTYEVSKQ